MCNVKHHLLEVALALMGSVGIVAWWFFKKLRRWWNNGYEILTDETLRPALILPNNARAMEGDKVEYLTTDGDTRLFLTVIELVFGSINPKQQKA